MDVYTPFGAVAAIVVGVVFLRIFFTLWGPLDRKLGGDKLDVGKDIQVSELKNAEVNVHFKSGSQLQNVILVGYCSTHHEAPYEFKQLLILKDNSGKQYYARISEIEYFEQVPASSVTAE